MLSPHEFATLILVKDAGQQSEFDQEDLRTLLDRQLVELERVAPSSMHPRVTDRGYALLARLHSSS